MRIPHGMSETTFINIYETYLDFASLVIRWRQVKDDTFLRKKFCTRNRNPLFDITKGPYFDTNLCSEASLTAKNKVKDHYYQRSKVVGIIFEILDQNPEIGIQNFIHLLKHYCSVVTLAYHEHQHVTSFCKSNPEFFNHQAYEKCAIKVEGLENFLK
jgi:hypothetical protein